MFGQTFGASLHNTICGYYYWVCVLLKVYTFSPLDRILPVRWSEQQQSSHLRALHIKASGCVRVQEAGAGV
jgi:hypothetical protein